MLHTLQKNKNLDAWLSLGCLVAAAVFFARGRWLMALGWTGLSLIAVALRLPRGRRAWFAVAAIALSVVATMAFVAGVDLYLHHRFSRTGGYNVWGYRGPTVGKKRPGEQRLVVLGGSVAFGYGVLSDQTIPHYLEQRLNDPPAPHPISVVNLAWNSEGAYSFQYTLRDYEYLDYDGAILYSGYNDVDRNNHVFRHQSAVFRLTGYLPILPIIPIRQWLYLENLSDTMRDGRVVFRPGLADRYTTEATETALRITKALERELQRLTPRDAPGPDIKPECETEFADYCRAIGVATEYSLSRGKQVFVVTEPYLSARHVRQQAAVAIMLRKKFANDARVHYIDMGRSVNLADGALCFDGMHLTVAGNARVADALAPRIREIIAE